MGNVLWQSEIPAAQVTYPGLKGWTPSDHSSDHSYSQLSKTAYHNNIPMGFEETKSRTVRDFGFSSANILPDSTSNRCLWPT